MFDWKFYNDFDGNQFYIDSMWNIYPIDNHEIKFKIVSINNIDYSYNIAVDYLKNKEIDKALSIFKSILLIQSSNNIVLSYKIKSAKEIKKLKKNNGNRFFDYDQKASILIWKKKNFYFLVNDNMRYRLFYKRKIKILSRKFRNENNYSYSGLKVGAILKKNKSPYLYLTTVNCEKFSVKLRNINQVEENWRNNLGKDIFERKFVKSEKDRIIYSLNGTIKGKMIVGYESFMKNGKIGCMVRVVTSKEKFTKLKNEMLKVLVDFVLL